MDADVVVVGAGPTGLALACGLRAAGVAVRVLDGAAGPAVTSRALGLQPRGVEVLDRLGALGDLPNRGIPIGRVVINVDGRELAQLQIGPSMQRLRGRTGLIMSQADIEARCATGLPLLADRSSGVTVSPALDAGTDGVIVRLGDGTEVCAGWVVGADGAHSIVRKAARRRLSRRSPDRTFPARRCARRSRPAARRRVVVAARDRSARRVPAARGRPVAGNGPGARRTVPTILAKTRSSSTWPRG